MAAFTDRLLGNTPDVGAAASNFGMSQDVRSIQQAKAPRQELGGVAAPVDVEARVAERMAREQEEAQLKEFDLRDQITDEQRKAQRQVEEQKKAQLTQRRVNLKDNFTQRTGQILDQWRRKGEELDFNRQKAQAEQLGFLLRLDNEKYLSELQAEGIKSRLNDRIAFEEQLAYAIFDDELELFRDSLTFRRLMRADDRAFEIEMAKMNIDDAIQLAMATSEQAAQRSKFEAVGGLASAAVQTVHQGYKAGWFDEAAANAGTYSPQASYPSTFTTKLSPEAGYADEASPFDWSIK